MKFASTFSVGKADNASQVNRRYQCLFTIFNVHWVCGTLRGRLETLQVPAEANSDKRMDSPLESGP